MDTTLDFHAAAGVDLELTPTYAAVHLLILIDWLMLQVERAAQRLPDHLTDRRA